MKTLLGMFTVAFVLTTTLAVAGEGPGGQKPRPLGDGALDRITAGSASGGAIVASSSDATINQQASVDVRDSAQRDARALNLVNAADSAVANAVNVWDGRVDTQNTATVLNIDQTNRVTQNMARSASLPSYVRAGANIDETSKVTRDVNGSGKVDTVSKVLEQEVQGGEGFAGAASADLTLNGGSIGFRNNVRLDSEGGSGFDVGGGLFGGDIDQKTTVETTQTLTWKLPDLALHVEGVVCAVSMGSCEAEGSFKSLSELSRTTSGPVAMQGARAEYIAVDGSTLQVTSDNSVVLGGSAQQGARALNLVNASGSAISNSVNVARSPTVGPALNLNQFNVIQQGR
jgi:hypothetical protein